jgi:hypothetical protein
MIAWPFIARWETNTLKGYVPMRDGQVIGESGVTVAMGVDLGAEHVGGYLDSKLLDPNLRALLDPYLGKQGREAITLLSANPLTLTLDQRDHLNAVVQAEHTAALTRQYNHAGNVLTTGGWNGLGDAEQTVIASVAWQYGTPWVRCPRFWGRAVAQDWRGVIAELRAFGDDFPTRRKAEATLLEMALDAPVGAAHG